MQQGIFIPFTENWQVEKDLQIWSLFRKNNLQRNLRLVVELKWDKSAESAIKQMKEKKYFESLEEYQNNMLLVGINYDKKTKEHVCKIEEYLKK